MYEKGLRFGAGIGQCVMESSRDQNLHANGEAVGIDEILRIYTRDKLPEHSRPEETAGRLRYLAEFWSGKTLADVSGRTCREYVRRRLSAASARRELEDFRSAINFYRKEGYSREIVSVQLPERAPPRERWLTRSEAARLIWAAYRYREVQKGHATGRRSRVHVARFILLGLYTGTRAGAICAAAFTAGSGQGFLDLERGIFYRHRHGAKATKKRQTPVRLPDRVLTHLRRWHRLGLSQKFAVEFNGLPIGKINKAFARVVAEAGLGPDVTPHVLRHTAATWIMQHGVSVSKAAGFLGMTADCLERNYGHHHPDFQEEAALAVTNGHLRLRKR